MRSIDIHTRIKRMAGVPEGEILWDHVLRIEEEKSMKNDPAYKQLMMDVKRILDR